MLTFVLQTREDFERCHALISVHRARSASYNSVLDAEC